MMNSFLLLVCAILFGTYVIEGLASFLNVRSLDPQLPEEFQGFYDQKKYHKSQEYTKAQEMLGLIGSTVNLAALLGFILLGGFPWWDGLVRSFDLPEFWTGIVFIVGLVVGSELVSVPFEMYRVFVLEERFGFNRTTVKVFVLDKLKEYGLMLILGLPLLAGLLLFLEYFPEWGWLYAWGLTLAILAALQYFAPVLILPLFNSFTPLEEGELRDKIMDYARRVGFQLQGIMVMDGSKRSTKSNAFLTGFGKKKRIALFDTLIAGHDPDELVAILAHEVGHYKHKHILKNLILGTVKLGVLLYLVSICISYQPLFEAFGLSQVSVSAGLVFFLILFSPVSLFLSLGMNLLSRRHEYQADRFAARTTDRPGLLISALKKLSVSNLANLTPHWFYVLVEYSHPPVLKRIQALRDQERT
jgi:STE24 endopeptidase